MRTIVLSSGIFLATSLLGQNAYLTNGFVPRYWKANTDYVIDVRVRNSSSTTQLISFHVDWNWNNGPVQTGNWQSTTGISPGQYWPYPHPIPFNKPEGAGTLKVWVVGVGDTDLTNDTLTFPVGVLNSWTPKSVLIEQYTGTWCQFCPNPNATTNTLNEDPLIVVAKHHNNDGLTSASSLAYWAQFVAEYSPAGVMEQKEFGTLPDDAAYDQWSARAELRKLGVSPAVITITPGFNDWTRLLTVDVTTTFTAAVSGDFTLNAYILEDNVPGPQTAAPSGYIHHQVVREVLGGAGGTTGIPATTAAGVPYAHQYTFTIPQEWNADNLRVIAMVTEHRTSGTHTVNVADAEVVYVGVEERTVSPIISIQPNPSVGALRVQLRGSDPARVQVLSMDGRICIDLRTTGGTVTINEVEQLAPGAYVLRVQQAGITGEQRIVRQ